MIETEALKKYKAFVEKYVTLTADEWTTFQKLNKVVHYKKGDVIHSAGDICTQLCFMNYGIVRVYAIDSKGKDFTWNISFNDKNAGINNVFLVDFDSFINQSPSKLNFEVLENSQVIAIEYKKLQAFYNTNLNSDRLGRKMAELAFSYNHNLRLDKLTKSATQRYADLINKTPYLLDKVPQYHIATLLGITPQSLSRIKRSMNLGE